MADYKSTDYKPERCANCHAETWCELRANGKRQCRACKVEFFFAQMLYPPLGYKLIEWQRKVLRELYGTVSMEDGRRKYRSAYISVGKKNGKQLSLDTPIPTPAGWSSMGELGVGDYVFSECGAPIRILAKSDVDETERAFNVSFDDGTSIVAGARHEWSAQKHSGRLSGIFTTQELFEQQHSSRCYFRIPVSQPVTMPDACLPVHPYLYGFWLGNGCATKPEVTVNRQDARAFLANVEAIGEAITWTHEQDGESNVYRVPSLRPLLVSHFSLKRIAPIYLRASVAQRWELLAGLMDSDGCISTGCGQAIYSSSVEALSVDVLQLVRSLGSKASREAVESDRYGKANATNYRILFTAYSDMPCSRLQRKLERRVVRDRDTRGNFHHLSVAEVEPRPMQCIQVDNPTHLYLAGDAFVPTHNSFLLGGLPLYHMLMEDEHNPEAYGAAAAKDQAGIIFKSAAQLVAMNPALQSRLKVLPSTKRIVMRPQYGIGSYVVLSADGDVQDGIEPSLAIRDEVHRWKTARAETLRDVIVKGQISRAEPLNIGITTAGAEYESPLWWQEYQHAKRVLDGTVQDDSFYVAIWEADAKRMESEPDYWKSREARVAANPSHQDYKGGFLKDSAIVGELNKAISEPSERSKYLRYHLNLPIKSQEDPIIDMPVWQACGGDVDLRTWPEYDEELLVRKWGLVDQPCWAGIDASWTTDLTAIVFTFPPIENDDRWTLLPFFFMPQERVQALQRICRVPYATWIEQKFITATPGNAIDLRAVLDRIRWGKEIFDLREVPYDRMNFRTEALNLIDEDIKTFEVQQSFLHLSYAMKFLLSAYVDKKIRHGNNPVLNWMAGCLQLQYDKKDNCQPSKPERMKSSKRIDGIQAAVTGLARALVDVSGTSVYESRGLISI